MCAYVYMHTHKHVKFTVLKNLYKQCMQMLKYSNHTDKLCHGFPRPRSGLLIPKENSQDYTVIFIARIITAEGYRTKAAKGEVCEAKSRRN